MFPYVKRSTHEAVVAELATAKAELDRQTSRLAQERENCRGADATARLYRDQCDRLTAKLSKYTRGLALGSAASAAKRKADAQLNS